jgi:hypothetical protein
MADLYREKVLRGFREALAQPDSRVQAADLLRGFVDEIRLTPEDGTLSIAVKGNLAGVLTAAGLSPVAASSDGCGGATPMNAPFRSGSKSCATLSSGVRPRTRRRVHILNGFGTQCNSPCAFVA